MQEATNWWLKWEYISGRNPDVDVEEMKKSDSKSKYVHGQCLRWTIPLTLETIETEDEMEAELGTESEDETEDEIPEAKKMKMQ